MVDATLSYDVRPTALPLLQRIYDRKLYQPVHSAQDQHKVTVDDSDLWKGARSQRASTNCSIFGGADSPSANFTAKTSFFRESLREADLEKAAFIERRKSFFDSFPSAPRAIFVPALVTGAATTA